MINILLRQRLFTIASYDGLIFVQLVHIQQTPFPVPRPKVNSEDKLIKTFSLLSETLIMNFRATNTYYLLALISGPERTGAVGIKRIGFA